MRVYNDDAVGALVEYLIDSKPYPFFAYYSISSWYHYSSSQLRYRQYRCDKMPGKRIVDDWEIYISN